MHVSQDQLAALFALSNGFMVVAFWYLRAKNLAETVRIVLGCLMFGSILAATTLLGKPDFSQMQIAEIITTAKWWTSFSEFLIAITGLYAWTFPKT